jgi:hypothetical protein
MAGGAGTAADDEAQPASHSDRGRSLDRLSEVLRHQCPAWVLNSGIRLLGLEKRTVARESRRIGSSAGRAPAWPGYSIRPVAM